MLLPQQFEARQHLAGVKVAALFMEAGTGKTRTVLELLRLIPELDYVLYVAPLRTIKSEKYEESIPYECEKHGGIHVQHDFMGVESIGQSDRIYLNVRERLLSAKCAAIVVDESIKIKNIEAKRTKRIIELGTHVQYKYVLNGTPITRDLLDVWSQFEFLSPKILGMNLAQFKNTYCEWVRKTTRHNGKTTVDEFITGYHNIDHLYSIIRPYVYECDLVLDVDEETKEVEYKLSDEDRDTYNELKRKYLDNEKLAFLRNNIFIELTQKMQHEYCCTEDKFVKLAEIISSHNKEKVIVYCKFILSREQVQQRFPDVEVLSYGKHTYGLNKQSKNVTVFFDRTFDYGQYIQAKRRTYRTGQKDNCTYYNLTGDVGLEDMLRKNNIKKQSLLQYFKQKTAEEIISEL
jgi:SNF2 family DNA or RNA helicase